MHDLEAIEKSVIADKEHKYQPRISPDLLLEFVEVVKAAHSFRNDSHIAMVDLGDRLDAALGKFKI